MKYPLCLLMSCLFISCEMEIGTDDYKLEPIATFCKEGGEPNLFVSQGGEVYLSWVEFLNDTTDALVFSKMENGQWNKPAEIARGDDWFVNWADFPSLSANGNWLAAHWLQKSAGGTYDYDVRISQSTDHGKNWNSPFIPHRDSIAAEHGFVTIFPISKERMFAVWLDGRNTKQTADDSGNTDDGHGYGHTGAMTLRAAEFDKNGHLYEEAELDNRICDCCQTDAVMTSEGPIVVYRDRSEHEIRDICFVRKVDGEWTNPNLIHADNWEIAGCPVNGPAVVANGKKVAVAWFTSAQGESQVKVAFSENAGAVFSAPVIIDDGRPLGRVDIEFLENNLTAVTWLEQTDEEVEIRMAKVSPERKIGESITLQKTSPARSSGFPVLAKYNNELILAWTGVDSVSTVVKTGRVKLY